MRDDDQPPRTPNRLPAARIVYSALPHATVTELRGVGHYPQSEAPEAVAAAVRTP